MAQSIPNDCRLIEDAFKHVLAYESTICEQICIIDLAVSAILLHLLRNATLPPPQPIRSMHMYSGNLFRTD